MNRAANGEIVVLLGPPGVGKGTQGVLLAEGHDLLRHLSTGDLLRAHRKQGTELGEKAQGYMDRGELVPDALMLDMVRAVLGSLEREEGMVLDGFPRTEAQARALDGVLAELDRWVDPVVVLEADEEVIVERLAGRRSCPRCGAVFNVHTSPPAREGRCDRCGEALVHRPDDDPETIRRRLAVYREETEPLIRYYREGRARVVLVNGEGAVEQVQAEVRGALGGEIEQTGS